MRTTTIATAAIAFASLAIVALWAAPTESEARKRIVDTAQSFKGVPYVYGAESPQAFDCSGFVQYVYAQAADIDLPRNSRQQWAAGKPVEKDAARPGDVFVFDTVGGGGPSHVAIFLGGDSMIHAISEGPKTGVVVSPISDRYFGPRMIGARYFIVSAAPITAAPIAAPAKSAPEPSKPAPSAPAKPATTKVPEPAQAQIGFTVKARGDVFMDPIPAATGTAIAFTITNGTGKDGVFHIVFYKADKDFSKTRILREERAMIRAGAAQEIPAYTFTEPGRYRINVKTADNTQMMQRSWDVVDLK